MASLTLTGSITLPNSSGGSNTSVLIGAPVITTASTAGPTLTITERSSNTYVIPTGAPFTVPLGTLSSSDLLYIGSDQIVTVVLNSGTFTLAAGGFMLIYLAGITVAPTIEPTILEATVDIILAEV